MAILQRMVVKDGQEAIGIQQLKLWVITEP